MLEFAVLIGSEGCLHEKQHSGVGYLHHSCFKKHGIFGGHFTLFQEYPWNTARALRLLLFCNENCQVLKNVHNLKWTLMDLSKFSSGSASLRDVPWERSYDLGRKVTAKVNCLEDNFFSARPLYFCHMRTDSGPGGFGTNIVKILAAWWQHQISPVMVLLSNREWKGIPRDILSISWRKHRNISVIWLAITSYS